MSFTLKHTFAPQPTTERGRSIQLGSDPKGKNFLYTNGRAVIIRNLEHPEIASEYTEHTCQATVARYSPSGFYIASGDVQGNIKIWDTTQEEHLLKIETKAISGKINDLDWDFESKRLVAVGEGKDRFGSAFLFDSASSCGEIAGHSKAVNSVSIKPGRPLRAVTGSDDATANFYHAVPFKFNKSLKEHSRFVQCVRYAPTGDHFFTAASDAKLFLYDGKTGDLVAELSKAEGTHTGSIYSASWSPDSKNIISGSGDMTVKLWDVAAQKIVSNFTFADKPTHDHQQVGTLWSGSFVISASLNGDINYLDPRASGRPVKVIRGHQRGITSLTVTKDKRIYTGSYDGRICNWELGVGGSKDIDGVGHKNQIISLGTDEETVYSCGMDDSFRSLSVKALKYNDKSLPTGSLPKDMAVVNKTAAIVTGNAEVLILKNSDKQNSLKTKFAPTAVAISPDEKLLAVGSDDSKTYVYNLADLSEKATLASNKGQVTCLAYSPKGDLLAVGDTQRTIIVYDTTTNEVKIDQWVFHNARVNTIDWSPDGTHAVSGSVDTNVEVWSVANPMKHISIKKAHVESVTGAKFLDNETIVSAGGDALIKVYSLKL